MIHYLLSVLIVTSVACSKFSKIPRYPLPDLNGKHGPRIVGGVPAKLGEFIGQVSLQNHFRSHVCGGTLVDPMHVVTAAHCLQYRNPIVYVMGDDMFITRNGSLTRQLKIVKHFYVHESYEAETLANDIAIIRLDSPFILTENFGPIDRSISRPNIGDNCTVVGWGYTSDDEGGRQVSINLLKVNVEIVNLSFCNMSYDGALTPQAFCAGSIKNGGRDSCQGDSGGLLTCDATFKSLTGIVSFGYSCGLPNFPGVYTDVQFFNKWIDWVIGTKKLPNYDLALPSTTEAPEIQTQQIVTTAIPAQANTTEAPSKASRINLLILPSTLFSIAILRFI